MVYVLRDSVPVGLGRLGGTSFTGATGGASVAGTA
jgi:hypothetical protein